MYYFLFQKMSYRHKKRHRSRSPESSNRRKRPTLKETSFERFRSKLNKIFFRDEDMIQVGTEEYRDFWKFLSKYQSYQKLKSSHSSHSSNYNKRLAQSFRLQPKDPKDLLCRIAVQDVDYSDEILTEEMVSEFQTILGSFIDFLQKDKFTKLKKLRQSQANLPIAEYRQEILETLEKNQVIIIAGDTGCGKSTQVPQYLLQANYAKIACTQPRRIACISLAKRVGYETLSEYGSEVS